MSNKLLVLEKIASLAGELDGAGLFAEADALDSVIVSLAGKHGKVIKVPDIRQYNEYSCGSACLHCFRTGECTMATRRSWPKSLAQTTNMALIRTA
jgi:hypothetical protein